MRLCVTAFRIKQIPSVHLPASKEIIRKIDGSAVDIPQSLLRLAGDVGRQDDVLQAQQLRGYWQRLFSKYIQPGSGDGSFR